MSSTERPEQAAPASHSQGFSLSAFVHEAFEKGVVKAVEDHPVEATVTAAGAVAAGAAAIYVSKGECLAGLLGRSGEEATVSAGVDRDLLARLRTASATGQVPGEKGVGSAFDGDLLARIRGPKGVGDVPGQKSMFSSFTEAGYKGVPYRYPVTGPNVDALLKHGIPISPEVRALSTFEPALRASTGIQLGVRSTVANIADRPITMGPAIEDLLTHGVPISTEAGAASTSELTWRLPPSLRTASIRGITANLQSLTESRGSSVLSSVEQREIESLPLNHWSGEELLGKPTPAVSNDVGSMYSPYMEEGYQPVPYRSAAVPEQITARDVTAIGKVTAPETGTSQSSMYSSYMDADYRHVPYRPVESH